MRSPTIPGVSPAPRSNDGADLPTALLVGFAVVAAANAAGSLIQLGPRAHDPLPRVIHLAFVISHHAFVAMTLILVVGLYTRAHARVAPNRGGVALRAVAAFVGGLGFLSFLLHDDLMGLPRLHAALATCLLALAFPLLVAFDGLARRRVFWRLVLAAGAVGATAPNHAALKLNYPGFHVWLVVVGGLAASLALRGLRIPGRGAMRSPFALALASVVGAAGLAIPPSARASVELSSDESASLHRFFARGRAMLRSVRTLGGPDTDRSDVPAGVPLVPRDDLIVILVTMDAIRYDVFDPRDGTLPELEALALESVSFKNAYAPSCETKGTLAAIFAGKNITGLCWRFVEFRDWRAPFPHEDPTPRVPELLTADGFDTFTVPSTRRLDPAYGIARGFTRSVALDLAKHHLGPAVMPHLVDWLGAPSSQRRFAYVHLMDAHDPYDSAGKSGTKFERYLLEVTAADKQLGVLRRELEGRGLWDRTVLIVTADHGEAFGEHNQKTHGGSVYEELVHVPLVIRAPGIRPREVLDLTSLLDLGPTILDLAGSTTPGAYHGRSLVPLLRGESLPPRPAPIESVRGHRAFVFPDGIKLITRENEGSLELYDLNADPTESRNLADERDDVDARLEAMESHFASNEARGYGCQFPGFR